MKRISTKALKRITTFLILIPFVLMLAGPKVIQRPSQMTAKEYVRRIAGYGALILLSSVGAGFGAYAIMRREQERYRERAMDNMRDLVEGTRQARLAKQKEDEGAATPQDE